MNKPESNIVHSTSEGKLYIKEEEFFNNDRVRDMVKRLINSSVYTNIKANRREASKN